MAYKDPEVKKAKAKAYNARPDIKAKRHAYSKQYYQDNKDRLLETNKDPKIIANRKAYDRAYYMANKNKALAYRKRYIKDNKDKVSELGREYRNQNKDRVKNSKLKYSHGITLDQYNGLLTKQNGVCAICCNPEVDIDPRNGNCRSLAVDHDHTTLKVRGLLCSACNRGIGLLKDSPAILIAAAKYLTEHKEKEYESETKV